MDGAGTTWLDYGACGNRTWKGYLTSGVQRYVWDDLGRMKSCCGLTEGAQYVYRADGLRTKKITGLTITWVDDESQESEAESSGHYDENQNVNLPTARYFYDGQMCMEEDYNPSQISLPQRS